jgi:prevent-host-death family protein
MNWQVQTAKQRFSELLDRAIEEGPQVVTRHGRPVAVLVAIDEFRRLREGTPDFKRFLLDGPLLDGVDLERAADSGRDVEL